VNPLTWPFKLPLRPVQAVIGLAETIEEQAQRELRDPARVRRELEEAQRRAAAGEITDEELAEIQNAAMRNLIPTADPSRPPAASRDDDRS
jgi:DNA-binding FadR family transcriptional regulator